MQQLFSRRYKAFRVGPLPARAINRVLGTELEPADVWMSKACHRHVSDAHPDDYDLVLANIVDIIRSPTWVGQDARHGANFYLVRRIPAESGIVLVAIGLERSVHGTYNIRSAYAISQEDVDRRRLRGALKPMPV